MALCTCQPPPRPLSPWYCGGCVSSLPALPCRALIFDAMPCHTTSCLAWPGSAFPWALMLMLILVAPRLCCVHAKSA